MGAESQIQVDDIVLWARVFTTVRKRLRCNILA
jgi:hypothetical protein